MLADADHPSIRSSFWKSWQLQADARWSVCSATGRSAILTMWELLTFKTWCNALRALAVIISFDFQTRIQGSCVLTPVSAQQI